MTEHATHRALREEADAHAQEIAVLRIDLDAARAEIQRLRAAGQDLLSSLWEHDIDDTYSCIGPAYRDAVAAFKDTQTAANGQLAAKESGNGE